MATEFFIKPYCSESGSGDFLFFLDFESKSFTSLWLLDFGYLMPKQRKITICEGIPIRKSIQRL